MKKRFLTVAAVISAAALMLAGCGNKAVEVIGEIEDMQEVADASTPELTSTPTATATPTPTQAPTPAPTSDTNLAEQEAANGSNNHSDGDGFQWVYTDGDFWDQILAAAGDDLSDEEWNKLMEEMAASMLYGYENGSSSGQSSNSGGSSSSGGNSSSGNTTSSQNSGSSGGGSSSGTGSTNNNTGSGAGNTTSGQSAGSGGGGSSSGSGANNNTGNTTPSAPAAPEQPAQHSHSYAWAENGDSRILTCSCGVTTGITEYRYGSVWGYYDDGAAGSILSLVNEQRNATQYTVQEQGFTIAIENVASLNSSGDLNTKARNRAVEAATNFSHGSNTDECLAWGQGNVYDAVAAWCYSEAHARAMTNPDYVSGGAACFWFDSDNSGTNLTPIWVLELGR